MTTYQVQSAPTTHRLKWDCPGCGFHNVTKVEGGDPMPEILDCQGCGGVIETPNWSYNYDGPLDDLTEIKVNFK